MGREIFFNNFFYSDSGLKPEGLAPPQARNRPQLVCLGIFSVDPLPFVPWALESDHLNLMP